MWAWGRPKTVAEGQAKGGGCYHGVKCRGHVRGKGEWTVHVLVTTGYAGASVEAMLTATLLG